MHPGERIDETGILIRDDGGFALRRAAGGRFRLDLARVPVDEVEKEVRVIGTFVGGNRVEVEGIALIRAADQA